MKHVSDRTDGKYDIVLEAKKLAGYTLRLTHGEKHFPKRYRFSVTNKIEDKVMEIVDCLIMAQEIYPNTKDEYAERQLFQKKARAACRSMMAMMEIAAETFGIRAGTFEYWTASVTKLKNCVTSWLVSDQKRFKSFR